MFFAVNRLLSTLIPLREHFTMENSTILFEDVLSSKSAYFEPVALFPSGSFAQLMPTAVRSASLLFIDSAVEDYATLLQGSTPDTEVYLLNSSEDAIAQIGSVLAGRSNISSIQVLSHGESGGLQLGQNWLTADKLSAYATQFDSWKSALAEDADILLYGCNVAQGELGQAFVTILSQLTGADVAASIDITGSIALGGNWSLESQTGTIETASPFAISAEQAYNHTLSTFTVTNTNDSGVGSLRQAIVDANLAPGSDTVIFSGSVFTDATPDTIKLTQLLTPLSISSDITITGPGSGLLTIDGNKGTGIFQVTTAGILNIVGVSIIQASNTAITNLGTLTINNSYFQDNKSTGVFGGAIDNDGGTVSINNSQFVKNSAAQRGGAIWNNGALTITNTSFVGNSANLGGGAIYTNAPASTVNISTGIFSDNVTLGSEGGGGLLIAGGNVSVIRTSFTGNGAIDGGGIWNGGGLTVTNSTFSNNEAGNSGGGIRLGVAAAKATLNNVTMTLNTADADSNGLGDGGGISVFAGATATIANTIVAGNVDLSIGANPKVLDISGIFVDGGHNLIGSGDGSIGLVNGLNGNLVGTNATPVNALLGPQIYNVHDLLPGSPAIDRAGSNASPTDQRGASAVGIRDIGALELQSIVPISSADQRDFDRDGKDDILERNIVTGENIIRLSSSGFTTVITLPTVSTNWEIVNVFDYDKDGNLDLLWRNEKEGKIGIWKLNSGNFVSAITLPNVSSEWKVVDAGDFNRDGSVDLLWYNENDGRVGTWQMNGTAFVSAQGTAQTDRKWRVESLSDLNGDGFLDILWRNDSEGRVGYWKLDGFNFVEAISLPKQPNPWSIASFADFDRNGLLDILWRNEIAQHLEFWTLSGINSVSTKNPFSVGRDWKIADIADLTGDGYLDILWRNESDGSVGIWVMNGTTLSTVISLPKASSNWKIQRIANLTSDNRLDILWHDDSTGAAGIWELDGTKFVKAIGTTSLGGKNWRII
jgi:predicted outer membrane repeat protein